MLRTSLSLPNSATRTLKAKHDFFKRGIGRFISGESDQPNRKEL